MQADIGCSTVYAIIFSDGDFKRSVSLNAPPRPIMTLGSVSGATPEAL